jgi:hypothetical protein
MASISTAPLHQGYVHNFYPYTIRFHHEQTNTNSQIGGTRPLTPTSFHVELRSQGLGHFFRRLDFFNGRYVRHLHRTRSSLIRMRKAGHDPVTSPAVAALSTILAVGITIHPGFLPDARGPCLACQFYGLRDRLAEQHNRVQAQYRV